MSFTAHSALRLNSVLAGLRAAGEDTRLRLLALLSEGDLTVSDLTDILGQSQPRISRHLKLMVDAGLVSRHREGAWAFFRLAQSGEGAVLGQWLAGQLDRADPVIASDGQRLLAVRAARGEVAQAYFARHAAEWDRIRLLHASDNRVEDAIRDALGDRRFKAVLDLGTGTGEMLKLVAPHADRLVGVDANTSMLAVARANLSEAGLLRAELRQADLYALPVDRQAFDLVILHQVLHFLDDPARAIKEAAVTLAPNGHLLIVDFAPHDLDFLREQYAHRRLGFADADVRQWLSDAGLYCDRITHLAPPHQEGDELTVTLWLAHKQERV